MTTQFGSFEEAIRIVESEATVVSLGYRSWQEKVAMLEVCKAIISQLRIALATEIEEFEKAYASEAEKQQALKDLATDAAEHKFQQEDMLLEGRHVPDINQQTGEEV